MFQGDVVVLGKSSPIRVGEGRESENDRYCDIEFINNMMAKPNSHRENTAANDFLTVLSNQTGKYILFIMCVYIYTYTNVLNTNMIYKLFLLILGIK